MSVFIPAWVDMHELCRQICVSSTTVENWIAQGLLPPSRKIGGKHMWEWAEVHNWLKNGKPGSGPDAEAEAIRNATQRELEKLPHAIREDTRRELESINPKWFKD